MQRCLEQQGIKQNFLLSKDFFWRTLAKHRSMAECVAAVLGWISSGKMSLVLRPVLSVRLHCTSQVTPEMKLED